MHYLSKTVIVSACAVGLFGAAAISHAATISHAAKFDRLYAFGDSYSDSGAGYLDGNGPTAVAYLAKQLDIPFTHSKDPSANSQGINFAVTAAPSGSNEGKKIGDLTLVVGMQNQVEDFVARVKRKDITFNPDTTLFFIEGGLNDSEGPAKETTDNLTRQIELLKSVGARHVSLSLLPTKIPTFTAVGEKLNPAYRELVPALGKKLKIDLQLNDFGAYLDDIIQNPAKYGIVNTDKACAGRALFGEDTTPCATPDAYFYFHGDHPSTAVNRIVGEKLHAEIVAEKR
ncbi:SGNH/GDSL hydrolase family protein [Lysobacter fragariae]